VTGSVTAGVFASAGFVVSWGARGLVSLVRLEAVPFVRAYVIPRSRFSRS
jgi:hypothetical protein